MHTASLDLQAEMQRLPGLPLTNTAEPLTLLQVVLSRLSLLGMQQGELRPRDIRSLRDEEGRAAPAALLERFRRLPAAEQGRLPALLNGLGKLQAAAGDFEGAKTTFSEVARVATEPSARAEVRYNTFRVALEQRKWDEALAAVQEAAKLDPKRFAPF